MTPEKHKSPFTTFSANPIHFKLHCVLIVGHFLALEHGFFKTESFHEFWPRRLSNEAHTQNLIRVLWACLWVFFHGKRSSPKNSVVYPFLLLNETHIRYWKFVPYPDDITWQMNGLIVLSIVVCQQRATKHHATIITIFHRTIEFTLLFCNLHLKWINRCTSVCVIERCDALETWSVFFVRNWSNYCAIIINMWLAFPWFALISKKFWKFLRVAGMRIFLFKCNAFINYITFFSVLF